eukprot:UN3868
MEGSHPLGDTVRKVRLDGTFLRGRADRRQLLSNMGFVFSENCKRWEDFLEALRSFRAREGHTRVPQQHKENGYSLGQAVARVRSYSRYIRGHSDRLVILREIGFVFSMRDHHWHAFLTALTSFREREGHCRVPVRHKEGGCNLGAVVRRVRLQGHFIRGRSDRHDQLDRLGFAWNDRDVVRWDRFLQALQSFKAREGHCFIPQKHIEIDYPVGLRLSQPLCRGFLIRGRA